MAFSSVRENVTPNTQLELCWKMLLFIIFYINLILNLFYSFISSIDFPFIFVFISLVLYHNTNIDFPFIFVFISLVLYHNTNDINTKMKGKSILEMKE